MNHVPFTYSWFSPESAIRDPASHHCHHESVRRGLPPSPPLSPCEMQMIDFNRAGPRPIWPSISERLLALVSDLGFPVVAGGGFQERVGERLTVRLVIEETAPKRTSRPHCVFDFVRCGDLSASEFVRRSSRLISFDGCREACAELHCVHVGPQVVGSLLGGHESVCVPGCGWTWEIVLEYMADLCASSL